MHRLRLASAPVFLSAALAAGCGGGDALPGGGGDADGGAVPGRGGGSATPDQACAPVTKYCEKLNACAPFLVQLLWGDAARCAERVKLSCIEDVMAAGSGVTAGTISACAAALPSASCADVVEQRVTACLFRGTVANGAGCGVDGQCQSGECKKSGQMCGTCVAKATAGGACSGNEDCEPMLLCNKRKQCAAPSDVNGACDDGRPCRFGLYCKGGTCAAVGKAGDPCMGEDSCDLAQGFFCNPLARICQSLRTAEAGLPCGLLVNPPALCAASGVCKPNLGNGVCQAAGKDGEACGAAAGDRPCVPPAECTSGICRLPSSSTCR